MRTPTLIALLLTFSFPFAAFANDVGPKPVRLWPDGAPGAKGSEPSDVPELRIYLPPDDKATGCGLVVCPGGGYGALATDHEGHQVARWLNTIGVAAFVLKYRHGPRYRHPAPLQDVQRALRHVRAGAGKFGVSPDRIGVMGFSAGGHLASTAATHFDGGDPESEDAVERAGCRPDFAVLCYPVISMTEDFGHRGSRRNLLGADPDPELAKELSSETQVTAETPPTFLFHTAEDKAVPVQNSLAMFAALRKAGVAAELHVYQKGRHGVGLAPEDPVLTSWKERLADWLKASGFLAQAPTAAVSGAVTVNGQPVRWGVITFYPTASNNLPVTTGRIVNGKYEVPQAGGPSIGEHRVEIRSLGAVEPQPTIDDVKMLGRDLTASITEGKNVFNFDLRQ